MGFTQFIGGMRLSMKKHSPELMFIAGTVSMGAAIVSAFKARPKYEEVIEWRRNELKARRRAIEIANDMEDGEDKYPVENRVADRVAIGLKTGLKMAVVFWKTVAFAGAAVGFFFGYGRIYKGWFLASAAMAEATSKKLKALEAATLAEVGQEKMQDIKNRVYKDAVEDHYDIDEEGNRVASDDTDDKYRFCKWFDEMNQWFKEGDPEANLNWLKAQLKVLNVRLQAKGYLLGNEIWEQLDMQKTEDGAIYGILAKKPDGTTNILDFGLYDGRDPGARNFINGYEDVFLIRPNFDERPIIDRIPGWTKH